MVEIVDKDILIMYMRCKELMERYRLKLLNDWEWKALKQLVIWIIENNYLNNDPLKKFDDEISKIIKQKLE